MIKRILKFFSVTLLLLILVVFGVVGWVAGTESGFQQGLALAKKFAPGTLAWDEAEGKLIGPLMLRGFQYSQDSGLEASVKELDFDWRPKQLFSRELTITQLHVDDIEVRLAEAEEPPEEETTSSGELPDISLPVAINLDDIAVTNVAIYPAGQDTPIEIERVALTGSVVESDVNLGSLEVVAPQGELQLEGTLKTSDDYPMDLSASWKADIGQSAPLQGKGTFAGSLAQLQIEHQVSGFALADISATLTDVTTAPAWDATIDASLPNPENLSPLLSETPEVSLQSTGTPDDYQAKAAVKVVTTDTGPVTLDADVKGSTEMIEINSLVARLTDNGGELSVDGQVAFASLQSDIKGQWKDLSWPIQDAPQFRSAKGSFDMKGTLDEFKANVSTSVDGEAIPEGQWDVAVDGSSTALSGFNVKGQTLDGTITASGTAGWENQPEWDVKLVTDKINPGKQWSELPGSINLEVSSKGQINDDGPQLNADIKRLSGRFRGQELGGGGIVRLAGETLNVDNLSVTHGASQIDANGQIDEQIALDFKIDSPDLATLLPDLAGAIAIDGSVSGTKDAPLINATGSADNVAYAENSVSTLNFSIDGGLADDVVSTLSLDAEGIAAGGQQISDVKLSGEGSQAKHTVSLSANTDQGNISTQLDGGYQGDTWDGALSSLLLENTPAGTWALREPVTIKANAEKADTSTLCLDNSDQFGSLCVAGNWLAAGESRAEITIRDLSPELASTYIPEGFVVQTKLNGDVTASLGADGNPNADVKLTLDAGKLSLDSDGDPIEVGLEQTTINATYQGNDATLDLATAFTELGSLGVQASVSDLAGEGRLGGSINADFPDLTLISAFAPQIQQVTGELTSNLSLGGTMQSPQVEGELALLDFSGEIPETAMLIKDTQLIVKGTPDGTLLITGASSSGDGELDLEGNVNPRTKALNLKINGDNYQVANTGLMRAVVSPELVIAMDEAGMDVKGKVTIPSAYINANGGNEGIKTVSSSSDVVFVSDEEEQAAPPPSALNLDVEVVLGDSIEVEAGDFKGRLEGSLRVQQTPEIAPRGTGTIKVVNGDYVIYGQTLNMERGSILFSGGPVDNPTLDMQVAREVPQYDVTAGARIKGTAQSPRLELYSDPTMPDASILSFILLGQPPGTGASYTLGKYLTPELYVSYGIGLFDAVNTFNLRYSLTDKLALEAQNGSGRTSRSSADIVYTIEK